MNRDLKSFLMIMAAASAIALGCCVQVPEPPERHLSVEEDAAIADCCAHGCVIVPTEIFEEMVKRLKERGA